MKRSNFINRLKYIIDAIGNRVNSKVIDGMLYIGVENLSIEINLGRKRLPTNTTFYNNGYVSFKELLVCDGNIIFDNLGDVYFHSRVELGEDVKFYNHGLIHFKGNESLPENFKVSGTIYGVVLKGMKLLKINDIEIELNRREILKGI